MYFNVKRLSPPFRSGRHRPYWGYKNNPCTCGTMVCIQEHGDTSSNLWANLSATFPASPRIYCTKQCNHNCTRNASCMAVVTARIYYKRWSPPETQRKQYNARCLPHILLLLHRRLHDIRRRLLHDIRRRPLHDDIRRRPLHDGIRLQGCA